MSQLIDTHTVAEVCGLSYAQVMRKVVRVSTTEAVLTLLGREIPLVKDARRWYALRADLDWLWGTAPAPLPIVQPSRRPTTKRT